MATLSVIIAAHGSSHHQGGASVAERCRTQLLDAGFVTGDVLVALWKGEGLRLNQAIAACPPGYVLIIPLLMNDGYFGEKVFPREFGSPVQTEGWQRQGDHHVRLSPPAGLDPRFDALVLEQALDVLRRADKPRLILTGHGTERDPRSSRRLHDLVAQIRSAAPDAASRLQIAFLDESPTIQEALRQAPTDSLRQAHAKALHEVNTLNHAQSEAPTVILPWFSADGAHAGEDIPAAVEDWGGSAVVLPSVGASLFPTICESRARAACDTLRLNDEL